MWSQDNQHCINLKGEMLQEKKHLMLHNLCIIGHYIALDKNQFYSENGDRKLPKMSESGHLVFCYRCGLGNINSGKVILILLKTKVSL